MSEIQNTPRLRFPEFYGSWKKKRLEDVGKIRMCKRIFNHQTSVSGEIPFYKIGTFGRGPDSYISKELYNEFKHKYSYPKVGDILISAAGTLGRTVIFDGSPSYFQDSNIVWIDNKENLITNEFLYYIYKIVRYESEGGTIQRLYNSIIYNAKFWKPSLPEQQKIADFLIAVDKRIELLEKKKTLLETYKKGVMKKIFNQEIRFKDENGNDFPDWEEMRLGDITNKKSSNISANSIEQIEGDYIVYGATGELKKIDFYEMDRPYISIVKDGSGVGRVNMCKPFSSVLGTLDILTNNELSDLDFVFQFLSKTSFLKYVTGSSIPHIYYKDYSKLKMLVPTIEEQVKISEFLSSIDNQIELLETQIDKSKTWKKGLLQKMFV